MLTRFFCDRRGNLAVMSAFMMVGLAGVAGLVGEYGNGLFNRIMDQRLTDTAAVASATIYDETNSSTSMNATVSNVAALNGLSGTVATSIVASPTGDGNQAIQVTVTSHAPLMLSRLLDPMRPALTITATSYAEMKPGANGCIIALNTGGSGVTLTGGTAINAPGCAIASNQTVTCSNGSGITTKFVYYDTTVPACSGLQAPPGYTLTETKSYTADPLMGTSEVLGQTSRLTTVNAITSPSLTFMNGSGTSLAFAKGNDVSILAALTAQGCTGSYGASTWTVTCNAGTHTFGTVSAGGNITVNFAVSGSSSNIYNFIQVNDGNATMNFGPGTYNIAQGVVSGTVTTFGAGTFNIGRNPSACNGNNSHSNESICSIGTSLTFGGPSNFTLAGGVYVKGSGSTLTMGSGSTNSYYFGTDTNGDSVFLGGNASVILADATGTGDIYQFAGNMNNPNGSSCLQMGAAAQHDVNGFFISSGGNVLGSGVWTVGGYVSLGAGGDVTCWGTQTGMTASSVTFVVGGATLDSHGRAFYVTAKDVTLTAPTSGATQGLAVIGPTTSSNTGTAEYHAGTGNTNVSGAFYVPYGAITGSSSANIGDGAGQCLEMIGSQVSMSGGSALASSCNIPGVGNTGSSGLVSLVQ